MKRSAFELRRFGNARLSWNNPASGERPADRSLCLIVVNGAVAPEMFVFFAVEDQFVAGTSQAFGFCNFDNVQAWISKDALPLPTFNLRAPPAAAQQMPIDERMAMAKKLAEIDMEAANVPLQSAD